MLPGNEVQRDAVRFEDKHASKPNDLLDAATQRQAGFGNLGEFLDIFSTTLPVATRKNVFASLYFTVRFSKGK